MGFACGRCNVEVTSAAIFFSGWVDSWRKVAKGDCPKRGRSQRCFQKKKTGLPHMFSTFTIFFGIWRVEQHLGWNHPHHPLEPQRLPGTPRTPTGTLRAPRQEARTSVRIRKKLRGISPGDDGGEMLVRWWFFMGFNQPKMVIEWEFYGI